MHAGQTICRRLFKLPIYENAKSVAVYLNMPTEEVQTAAIVEHMFAAGASESHIYWHDAVIKCDIN